MSCPNQTPIYIPVDLQINTLLRLPIKSLLRFRCVSKLWCSIITSRDFKKRYLNIASSSAPPRLLIAFEDGYGKNKLMFVSLPYPNASSSCCVPYRDLNILKIPWKKVYNAAQGLILFSRDKEKVEICNPSTRQLHIFPKMLLKYPPGQDWYKPCHQYFLGYDPVEDQYKVLGFDNLLWEENEHKVMVLGGEEAWRDAPCVAYSHIPRTSGLYMNGTLYYGALRKDPNNSSIIVSFDVRSETFNIIKVPMEYRNMWGAKPWYLPEDTLINYGGKVGVVEQPRYGSFRVWVVEDAEKEEWSVNTFHLPQSVAGFDFKVTGTFYTGEICLVQKLLSDPFCLFCFNLKTNSMTSVTIEGLPMSELKQVRGGLSVTVSDHYDSLMFL